MNDEARVPVEFDISEPMETLSIRVPVEFRRRFDEIAKLKGTTRSVVMVGLLRAGLKVYDEDPPKKAGGR